MKQLYVAVLAVLFAGWMGAAVQPQLSCTVTIKPGDSIQKAIDEVAPGAVICLEEGIWDDGFLIQKDITIRGAGPDKTIVRSRAMVWAELPITAVIQGFSVAGVVVGGPIRVTLQDVYVQGAGIYIVGVGNTAVDLVKTTVSRSSLILFQATVTLVDSQVIGAELGGIMVLSGRDGKAQLSLVNSRVLDNAIGISAGVWEESIYITLERSVIAGNRWKGLTAGGLAHIEIRESTIENNGTNPLCMVCPGIEVGDQEGSDQ
ncbi:MAG: hypothetical protein NZ930_05780 [Candidatus Bipolaricaulota bacterium]|nr:hypothetical protein [Candidatus Bipolaricaulota bacterium]MDW8030491.1 hypothetical protein [Candidatus Bipolaricaulota bacterium]